MNYNLIEEKWIPVLWRDGSTGRVGIREALAQAHHIRQIAASNPMDRLAILRFLLALLYWCKPEPPAEKEPMTSFRRTGSKRSRKTKIISTSSVMESASINANPIRAR